MPISPKGSFSPPLAPSPSEYMQISQCGGNIILGTVDASKTLTGSPTAGTVDATGVLTTNAVLSGQNATCSGAPSAPDMLSGSCSVGGSVICTITLTCVDGNCLSDVPAPVPSAGGYPDVGGVWSTTTSTCGADFSPSFAVTQCGPNLLVVPSLAVQDPNTGSLSTTGNFVVGTMKGSTVMCSGQDASNTMALSCTYDGQPYCTASVSKQ